MDDGRVPNTRALFRSPRHGNSVQADGGPRILPAAQRPSSHPSRPGSTNEAGAHAQRFWPADVQMECPILLDTPAVGPIHRANWCLLRSDGSKQDVILPLH